MDNEKLTDQETANVEQEEVIGVKAATSHNEKIVEEGDIRFPVKRRKRGFSARELTVIGMLGAITMLLGITGYGFIPLPFMKATILHIPTIIGTLLEGPRVGMIVGFLFGCFSLMQNIMVPSLMSFAFLNPLVSVLPRLLIGVVVFIVYKLLPIRDLWRIAISSFIGSIMHTVMVLGMIYLLYAESYAAVRNIDPQNVINLLLGVAVANGVPEAVVCMVVTTPIVMMVKKVVKKKE